MNLEDALALGNKILKFNNIDSHSLDSELLLAKTLSISREELLTNLNSKIEKNIFNNYKRLIRRRKQKEPIAYILKKKEFWKLKYLVNKSVLIPRPETELIIEEALKLISNSASKQILDVGTGSGCLILSILKERPKSYGTAIDISKNALKIAISNAKMHHLQNKIKFINIDIDKFNLNKYDFVISNPPYINKFDLNRLDYGIRFFEPLIALDGGYSGLEVIVKLIQRSHLILKKNGKLIFEIGEKQKRQTIDILKKNGFFINKYCNDLSGKCRVIISTKI